MGGGPAQGEANALLKPEYVIARILAGQLVIAGIEQDAPVAARVLHDGGAHFTASPMGLPALADYQFGSASAQATPGIEGDVWLTNLKELNHSTDSGKSYETIDGVTEANALGFGKPADGKKYPALYLIGKINDTRGFFRSDDAGATLWHGHGHGLRRGGGGERCAESAARAGGALRVGVCTPLGNRHISKSARLSSKPLSTISAPSRYWGNQYRRHRRV